jgi:DNA-binding transcriptional MerR regulator
LRQQRENYLPLKVIKDRLVGGDAADANDEGEDEVDAATAAPSNAVPSNAVPSNAAPSIAVSSGAGPSIAVRPTAGRASSSRNAERAGEPGGPRRVLPEPSIFAARGASTPSAHVSPAEPGAHSSTDAPPGVSATTASPARSDVRVDLTSVSMTAQELADATGLRPSDIAELERFGLFTHRTVGNVAVYDHEALVVARLAAGFRAHGLEPRHLRMFKVTADREAALFEQVVLPLARQRTVEARRALQDTLTDLSRLTDSLHSVLLQALLRELD